MQADHGRVTVGLTGYPNVGKSSTINALFGSKKTAVAPTPGKTKHFQTLNITDGLTLCDCPGLVLPRYAQSKSEMVAAGAYLASHSLRCYANFVSDFAPYFLSIQKKQSPGVVASAQVEH